jgi:hypothetical protein
VQSRDFVRKLKKLLAQRIKDYIRRHAKELDDLAFLVELPANHMVAALAGLIERPLILIRSDSPDFDFGNG